jgi:hypothetical protein
VRHVEKEFTAKETKLIKFLAAVRRMEKHFVGFTFCYIPRGENVEADELAKAAMQKAPMPVDVFYQELSVKAIREEEERPCYRRQKGATGSRQHKQAKRNRVEQILSSPRAQEGLTGWS